MKYQIAGHTLKSAADAALQGIDSKVGGTARFRWNNGATIDVLLAATPIHRWAKTFGKSELFEIGFEAGAVTFSKPHLTDEGALSMIRMRHIAPTDKLPLERFEPVILEAPADGGEFTLTTDKTQVATRRARRDSLDGTLSELGSATEAMKRAGRELGEAYVLFRASMELATRTDMTTEVDRKRKLRDASRRFKRAMRDVNSELDSGRLPDLEHGLYFTADDVVEIKHGWLQYQTAKASERPKGTRQKRHDATIRMAFGSVVQRITNCIERTIEKDAVGWSPNHWASYNRDREPVFKARHAIRTWPSTKTSHITSIREQAAIVRKARSAIASLDQVSVNVSTGSAAIVKACKLMDTFTTADETRYVLTRILFACDPVSGEQVAVATDGRRLAILKGDYGLTHDPNATVRVLYRANGVRETDEMTYPNYRIVIPCEFKEQVTLPVNKMIDALNGAAEMTSEKSNSVKLTFETDTLTIEGTTVDVGDSKVQVSINWKGKTSCIAFQPGYLLDIMTTAKKLGYEEITFQYQDELSPGVFVSADGNYKVVLMPMRMS